MTASGGIAASAKRLPDCLIEQAPFSVRLSKSTAAVSSRLTRAGMQGRVRPTLGPAALLPTSRRTHTIAVSHYSPA